MSVFNSSVTGGCCFCVSKAHVNKQAELFKTERSVLTHAGSASPAQRQSCWDNLGEGKGTGKREEMMSSVKVQIVQTQIELSWAEHGGGVRSIIPQMRTNSGFGCEAQAAAAGLYGKPRGPVADGGQEEEQRRWVWRWTSEAFPRHLASPLCLPVSTGR